MAKILLLVGDSNVKRWITHLGDPYQAIMDFAPAHNSEELPTALAKVTSSYQMVSIACLTNVIVGAGTTAASPSERMEKIQTALSALFQTVK